MINPNPAWRGQGFRLLTVVGRYCLAAILLCLLLHGGGTVVRA
ncbi:MAG TPA: hypothetical protein VN887_04800 [Candidatus Angelobacter sp.]|nr:hypothetical protein [Candidatus Angelobacter sp.]